MPQAEGGGFGGSERHDPHLLYTLSAVQVLALYDRLHEVDADRIAACVPQLTVLDALLGHGTMLTCDACRPFPCWKLCCILTARCSVPLCIQTMCLHPALCGASTVIDVRSSCGNMRRDASLVLCADVSKLQQPDGSFAGDTWGEVDTRCVPRVAAGQCCCSESPFISWQLRITQNLTRCSMRRFSYCALLCCRILDRMTVINVSAAVDFVVACQNFDGGFGCTPGVVPAHKPLHDGSN